MSSNNASGKVVSVDEQAFEKADGQTVDEDGFPVVDETPEFEATVEEETQAKVDANHPDGIADTSEDRIHGVTLEQEERIQAREAELERISAQAEPGTQDDCEQRTREVVSELCGRDEPDSVERTDPQEELTQDELAEVNEQAMRISDEMQGGWSRAVVAKQLAEKVARGRDVTKAVLETLEEAEHVAEQHDQVARTTDNQAHEYLRYAILRILEGQADHLPTAWTPIDGVTVGYGSDDAMFDSWGASEDWWETVPPQEACTRFRVFFPDDHQTVPRDIVDVMAALGAWRVWTGSAAVCGSYDHRERREVHYL